MTTSPAGSRGAQPGPVQLEAFPAVASALGEALVPALRDAGLLPEGAAAREPWRRAALDEALGPDDPDVDYALSPRSTRGATRA